MRPLTYVMPKCLLPLGGKPLLERTIGYLGSYGISDFVLCVAYLKKQIIDTFKDGSALGVRIEYAESDNPLGTGGQLKTAEPFLQGRFLALNGDIVTNMNITNLVRAHEKGDTVATIAVKRFQVNIPYGHITIAGDGLIRKFEEKPTLSYLANAGFYVLEQRIIDHIPRDRVSSLEREIFPSLIENGERVGSFFEEAYWADVGSMLDFERVNDEILSGNSEVFPGQELS